MLELSESDAGGERSVTVGDELVLRLAENRMTGYRWHLSAPGGFLTVVDDTYQAPQPGRPGAPGVRAVRLRATHPGSHELTAVSQRPWTQGTEPGSRLRFVIRVLG